MIESARQLESTTRDVSVVQPDMHTRSMAPAAASGGCKPAGDSGAAKNSTTRGRLWWTLIIVSIATDFLTLPVVSTFKQGPTLFQAITGFSLVGCTLAQGSLLAAWLVWSDAPFSRRLLWHWIIAGSLCCVWLIGLALAAPPEGFQEVGFTVALTVPIVSLGAQLPFWFFRLFFGWRLVRITAPLAAREGEAPAEPPLSIRDLLLATLLVAASFAVARLSPAAQQEPEFRFAWGLFMTAAATFSLIAIVPAAAILLRPRSFERALKYGLAYAAAPIILITLTVAIVRYYGLANLPPWQLIVGLTCLIVSYASTAILAAAVARDQGYVLAWGRRPVIYQADLAAPPAA